MGASVPPVADDPVSQALTKQAQSAVAAGLPSDKVAGRVAQMTAHLNEHPELRDSANAALARGVDPNVIFARLAQWSQGKPVQEAPEPRSTAEDVTGAIQSAVQGATFGAGNKLEALGEALLPHAVGGTKGFDYPQAMQDQTSSLDAFRAAHPIVAPLLEIAGSIPTALATGGALETVPGFGGATSALGRIGQAAARGAIQGGSYGALSSNDLSPSDIAKRAATGAAIGGGLGTLFQGGGEAVDALGGARKAAATGYDAIRALTGGPGAKYSAGQRIVARYAPTAPSEAVPTAEGLEPVGASVSGPAPTGALRNLRNAPSPTFEGDVTVPEEAASASSSASPTMTAAEQGYLNKLGITPEMVARGSSRSAEGQAVIDALKGRSSAIPLNQAALDSFGDTESPYVPEGLRPKPSVAPGDPGTLDPATVIARMRARAAAARVPTYNELNP